MQVTLRYCLRLYFIITSSLSNLLPMRALCGLTNKPLGAEVARVQKIVSNSTCRSANSAVFCDRMHCEWLDAISLPIVGSLHERQCVTHMASPYTDCFKNAASPRKFLRSLKCDDKDKDFVIENKDEDWQCSPRGSSRTRTSTLHRTSKQTPLTRCTQHHDGLSG